MGEPSRERTSHSGRMRATPSAAIGARKHRDGAGRSARGRRVDLADGRVRMRGTNERAGERAGQIDVGHEAPVPGEKALVLDAPQRRADTLIVPHAKA